MCFCETGSDTLAVSEQTYLEEAARRCLPAYEFSLHANVDAMIWAVLSPSTEALRMPRFTICRINPCVIVMFESHRTQRSFASLANVEDAMVFACQAAQRTLLAFNNVHSEPAMAH